MRRANSSARARAHNYARVSGFTLMEVLITILIVAPVMSGVIQLVVASQTGRHRADKLEIAMLLAQRQMSEIEANLEKHKGSSTVESQEQPGYTVLSEVIEEEINLFGGDKPKEGDTAPAELKGAGSGNNLSDIMKNRGLKFDSITGGIIKMNRLTVKVDFRDGDVVKEYLLETFKPPRGGIIPGQ